MTLPTSDSLRDLSRDMWVALVIQLAERLERLEAEVERLKRPSTTSHNSSQPPSRDQKVDQPKPKRRHQRRAKAGHTKAERSLTDSRDRVIEVHPSTCTACGQNLQALAIHRTVRRQITQLPVIQPVVIDPARLRGQSIVVTLMALMGLPVLPYLAAPSA